MRVGVDLDGVVYNFVSAFRNYRVSKGISFESMPDPLKYEMWSDWGISKEEFYESMSQGEAAGLFHQGQPYDRAIGGIRQLKADGHSIHIITHRLSAHAQTSTIGWLAANEIPYDTLTFAKEKNGYPIDICIEDQPHNAEAVELNGVPCFLITRPWNSEVPWERRVASWDEFVKRVRKEDVLQSARVVAGEVRETSPTGGQKGQKPEQYSLIPVEPLAEVARVYSYGAAKYETEDRGVQNWTLGYPFHLSYDALQRHVNAFWGDATYDPESGLHHLAHAVFHCLALIAFGCDLERYDKYDDRPR